MKKAEDISIDEIIEAFTKCHSNKEVIEYFGRKNNGGGQRFLDKIKKKANIDPCEYFNYNTKDSYIKKPKYCKNCGKVLPFEKRNNDFCNRSCSASYNNKLKDGQKIETKIKISYKIRGIDKTEITEEDIAAFISKQEDKKRKTNEEKIREWKSGINFVRGATQVPSFIKKYLFEKYDNRCQVCGWGEMNQKTHTIPLQIHHVDGDCTNNLEDNLQLLCPNCHSLTDTYGILNKNSKRFHRKKNTLIDDE